MVPLVAVTVCVSVTLALLVPPGVRHVPPTTIQPLESEMPPANVDVDILVTMRLFTLVVAAARLPEKVEVEFVPTTLRKPWMVEVPVVSP